MGIFKPSSSVAFSLFLLTFSISLSVSFCEVQVQASSFEDTRCKCVCDKTWDASGKETRAVFTNTTRSEQCDCEHVVKPLAPQLACSRCLCRTETRNTTTIKVVVIFIICVVSLLFIYMLFLLCLDPLMQRKPHSSYVPYTNEEEDLNSRPRSQASEESSPTLQAVAAADQMTRQRSILDKVSTEQKKWKGTVQKQRENIYDRHAMLN